MHSVETTSQSTGIDDPHMEEGGSLSTVPNDRMIASWSLAALSSPVSSVDPHGGGGNPDPNQTNLDDSGPLLGGTIAATSGSHDLRSETRQPQLSLEIHDGMVLEEGQLPAITNAGLFSSIVSSFSLSPSCATNEGAAREDVLKLPKPATANLSTATSSQHDTNKVSVLSSFTINTANNDMLHLSTDTRGIFSTSSASSSLAVPTATSTTDSPPALLNRKDSSSVRDQTIAVIGAIHSSSNTPTLSSNMSDGNLFHPSTDGERDQQQRRRRQHPEHSSVPTLTSETSPRTFDHRGMLELDGHSSDVINAAGPEVLPANCGETNDRGRSATAKVHAFGCAAAAAGVVENGRDDISHPRLGGSFAGSKRKVDSGAPSWPYSEETTLESTSINDSRNRSVAAAFSGANHSVLPHRRRDSVPLDLRNKRMRPTDCLLFAATLLEEKLDVEPCSPDSVPFAMVGFGGSNEDCAKVPVQVSSFLGRSQTPDIVTPANGSVVDPPIAAHKTLGTLSFLLPRPSRDTHSGSDIDLALLENANPVSAASKDIRVASTPKNPTSVHRNDRGLPAAEATSEPTKPRDVDVLCGRGGSVNKHKGNIVYRKVVDYNKAFYQSVHKKHRILVSQSIVQSIINYGGRFLITGPKGTKTWIPIGFKRAVQKTSQALRERPSGGGGGDKDDGNGENDQE